ncbi:multi-sensor signal transduction histidine kinase [Desulforamulus reducens MI-1]|uniref:histidine kinase n=1 Tax=Desulforamulus reducens (strain ATCC BAA-1160 / DSM 100696 / MI-1) TaxID=349161 RepID=A4J6W1_DESRM|nr:ATP-binding protein [Desulforamulus reducens]ABO50814.1 multi-sensor signal transduction histidine kinase [Desulforamulus reducens MI-1]
MLCCPIIKNKTIFVLFLCNLLLFSILYYAHICYAEVNGKDQPGSPVVNQGNIFSNDQTVHTQYSNFYEINKGLVWVGLLTSVAGFFLTVFLFRKNKELTKSQLSLKQSEQRFARVFHANPNIQTINRLDDFRFIDVNDSFEKIFGYGREEVIGYTPLDFNLWVNPQLQQELLTLLGNEGHYTDKEVILRTNSGEEKVLQGSGVVVDVTGVSCVLISLRDITESKQMEKEIKKLDRLNLVGQVAAGIGHEIRNPLTTVRGFLQLFQTKKESCDIYKEQFMLMIEELDRANSIITEFLTLARNKPERVEMKNLNSIVTKILPLLQAQALKEEKYVYAVLDKVPDLLLDENEIRQIILNLIRNGLDAMSRGGNITIRTYIQEPHTILSIRDEGEGIKPEVLEKIGTPFYTTKDSGTGLGLAICYGIAERHNASVDVKTGPNGTIFLIKFPFDNQNQLCNTKVS